MLHTKTIITTEAKELVKLIHDRMPVILYSEAEELLIDEKEEQKDLLSLLIPYEANVMKILPCGPFSKLS